MAPVLPKQSYYITFYLRSQKIQCLFQFQLFLAIYAITGLDHTAKIAATLAKLRGLKSEKILCRKTSSVQRGANKATRVKQAKSAFTISTPISPRTTYILVDDVYTTGATMKYAAKTLRTAGAQAIWVVVTAVQISL